MSGYVEAKVNFYHDAVGSKTVGQVFQVDPETCKVLEQAGYVKKVEGQALAEHQKAQAEQQAKQQEYGQAQEQANQIAGLQAHEQHLESLKMTQEFNQARQQQAQSSQAQSSQAQNNQTQANLNSDAARVHEPSATTNQATLKEQAKVKAQGNSQANSQAVSRNKASDSHES
jgi:hypothetical protein